MVKPPKSRRKNWQYSVVEVNASHYQGIDVYQCNEEDDDDGDEVEISHISPEEVMKSQNDFLQLPKNISRLDHAVDHVTNDVEFQNNLQHADLQVSHQEEQFIHAGIRLCNTNTTNSIRL